MVDQRSYYYWLMEQTNPATQVEGTQVFASEADALAAAQSYANELGRPIDVYKTAPGMIDSEPFRTAFPRQLQPGRST
jgi:hypothetical protein